MHLRSGSFRYTISTFCRKQYRSPGGCITSLNSSKSLGIVTPIRLAMKDHSQIVPDQSSEWIDRLARLGYASKGIVYATVGILAAQTAFSVGGRTTGLEGALRSIASQPFGQIMLGIVAIGLVSYALWRFVEAARDPEHQERNAKNIARRIGYAINGVIYAGLAFTAVGIIAGASASGGGGSSNVTQQSLAARVMAQPFGRWLVGLLGAFLIGLAVYYFYRAVKAKFRKRLKLHEMSRQEIKWATRIGRFGVAARGVVFMIIGIFLLQAAYTYDASRVRSTEGALQAIQNQPPFGSVLLGIVALGLIAYGIHMGVQARYRRISVS